MSEPRKPTAEDQFSIWRCSCCGEIVDLMLDRSARWNGSAIEHRCAGHDPQAGYEPCRRFDSPLPGPCPSCAELRAEVARLRNALGEAAKSLETLSRAGAHGGSIMLTDPIDVRGYAASRGQAARDALAEAGKIEPEPES